MGIAGTIRSWPRRVRDSVEQEGLWRLGARMALSPVYRAVGLRAWPLDPDVRLPSPSISVRTARPEDGELLMSLRPHYDRHTVESRLRAREDCLLVFADSALAACCWGRLGEAQLHYVGLILPLTPHEVFGYDLYVATEFRRRDARKGALYAFNDHYLREKRRTIVDFVTPGRKPWGRRDFRQVATIRTLRLGPFRKFWVKTHGPQAECWRERLKELRWA